MGYTTVFHGSFYPDTSPIGRGFDEETIKLLHAFNHNLDDYREAQALFQTFLMEMQSAGVLDPNEEYKEPGGGYNQWTVQTQHFYNLSGQFLRWDGGEKFGGYVAWLQHIMKYVLIPKGYVFNGLVKYFGEDEHDMGYIKVENNVVTHVPAQFEGVAHIRCAAMR